ncbi:hypothetical protein HYC85_005344 [Camellia sinensis]|uniref:Uncharacterized protein n=1 Tax=Camellia sinensis TaxID=4442 RepID=A0A7J7HZM3_CAMSI|nr:hypothetical protein HYC85_005344 [Camellia sinensis]
MVQGLGADMQDYFGMVPKSVTSMRWSNIIKRAENKVIELLRWKDIRGNRGNCPC